MAKRKRVTARDVAELTDVSPSTVSRVLNDVKNDMISERTKQRVKVAAAKLGYSPDPIARALRGKSSNLLGVIVREIADPFFAGFISELSYQARELNYQIVLGHAQSDPEEALELRYVLDTRHTDGVFILGDLRNDENTLLQMLNEQAPVIALCRGLAPKSIITINTDNESGVYTLLDHLTELNHSRIAFIDGGWLGDIRERREAYVNYMNEQGLNLVPEWIQAEENGPSGGYRAMMRLLEHKERPTAVFASDDTMALGALKATHDAGLSVPDDISIAGFDDIEYAKFMNPSLTTMRQLVEDMVSKALQLMLEIIQQEESQQDEKIIKLPSELVVRQSTGPCSAV